MALLVQNQAVFVAQLAEANKERAEERAQANRERAELQRQLMEVERRLDLRITRIENTIEEIKAILVRHERLLEEMPEMLRQKIGFKTR
jgi:uncharacterized protein YlxW (UPF0749 family)